MKKDEQPYEVGYGKPPKSGQFSKGRSGNLKGRPKGSKNLTTVVLRDSRQPVRVNGPRGTKLITRLEAVVTLLGNKSVQGDLRSQREYLALVERSEEGAGRSEVKAIGSREADQATMNSIIRRMKQISQEESAPGTTLEGEK
jgi:hypothetical protein